MRRGRGEAAEAPSAGDILIPGAAMVIRETTTWEMPLTAAFYGTENPQGGVSR